MEESCLVLNVPSSLTLCILPSAGSLCLFSSTAREASLMINGQGTDLRICRNIISSHFIATVI